MNFEANDVIRVFIVDIFNKLLDAYTEPPIAQLANGDRSPAAQ